MRLYLFKRFRSFSSSTWLYLFRAMSAAEGVCPSGTTPPSPSSLSESAKTNRQRPHIRSEKKQAP